MVKTFPVTKAREYTEPLKDGINVPFAQVSEIAVIFILDKLSVVLVSGSSTVGLGVGCKVGTLVGCKEGTRVGTKLGEVVGTPVG
mmetsp:Transcript_3800/g.4939  ORF Transcript_3800/g.4939 Transcript_3800/m.4939 type:complete len:85 (-) Transcript_3800:102-356(-)